MEELITQIASETLIDKELKKFNVTDSAIHELREKFMPLSISSIADKEGAKKVREARLVVKNERVKVEKMGKELRADAIKFQKAVIAEEKRIVSLLEPIETHLEQEEARIEEEKEQLRLEAERLKKERIQKRVNQLFQFGVQFNGDVYSLGGFSVNSQTVNDSSEEEWEVILSELQTEHHQEQERLAGLERIRAEEEARLEQVRKEQEQERLRLEALRKEQEEKEAKFRAEQEAIQKAMADKEAYMRAEQQRLEQERLQVENQKRIAKHNALFAIGLIHNGEVFCYKSIQVPFEEVEQLTASQFEETLANLKLEVDAIKAKEEQERLQEIESAKKVAAEKARFEAEEKAKREATEKAEQERRAKAEADRQAALRPDKEKLMSLSEELAKFPFPELTTPEAIRILEDAKTLMAKVSAHISNKAEAL